MIGQGSKLAYSASSPVDWTEITDVRLLEVPTFVADQIENTVYDTANRQKTTEPGLSAVAPVNFTIKTDWGAGMLALIALQKARTEVWWRIEAVANDGATEFMGFEFQGRIADFKPAIPIGGLQETQFTIQVSSAVYNDAAAGVSQI